MSGAPATAAVAAPSPSADRRGGRQVQVHAAALPLDLIDLAFAVVLTAGLEGEQLGVPRKHLERDKHLSYGHALSVAIQRRA